MMCMIWIWIERGDWSCEALGRLHRRLFWFYTSHRSIVGDWYYSDRRRSGWGSQMIVGFQVEGV